MLAVTISHTIDLGSLITGLATLGLAGATVWLGLSTRTAATATERESAASRDETELVRRQIEESQRPVVVPSDDAGRPVYMSRVGRILATPARVNISGLLALAIPVENVGAGPALNVWGSIQYGEGAGAHRSQQPLAAVAIGGIGALAFGGAPPSVGPQEVASRNFHRLELSYTDVAGKPYRTVATWDAEFSSYATVHPEAAGDPPPA